MASENEKPPTGGHRAGAGSNTNGDWRKPGYAEKHPPATLDEAAHALNCIDPDCPNDPWWRCVAGMAAEFGDAAYDVTLEWSARGEKFDARDFDSRWRGYVAKPNGGIGIGTVFQVAMEYGYRTNAKAAPPSPDELARRERDRQQRAAKSSKNDAAHAKQREKTALTAQTMWGRCQPAPPDHFRLVLENGAAIPPDGFRVYQGEWQQSGIPWGDALLVPWYDITGQLLTVQAQGRDATGKGYKHFLAGTQKAGIFYTPNPAALVNPDVRIVFITEGARDCNTVASIALRALVMANSPPSMIVAAPDCGHLSSVAKLFRDAYPKVVIVVCADLGPTELRKALEAATAVNGCVALPRFGPDLRQTDKDFTDVFGRLGAEGVEKSLHAIEWPNDPQFQERVRAYVEGMRDPKSPAGPTNLPTPPVKPAATPADNDAQAIAQLARLPRLDYARVRKAEAERLGVPVGELDAVVREARADAKADNLPGQPIRFENPESWPHRIMLSPLLEEIEATIRRHCILDAPAYVAAALWIVSTYALDYAHTAPILYLTSPEPRCGKSTLLDLLGRLVAKPLPAANVTPAALFRTIDAAHPTILLDEADAGLNGNEDLRGLLNCGHTRSSAYVIRIEGDNREPRQFNTWGCRAIAGIGRGAQTIMDRSIVIPLRRKLPNETVQKLRHAPPEPFERARRQIVRVVADHAREFETARPEIPESLNDRAADNWEPLLAIADMAGDEWPRRAREAALALSGIEDTKSLRIELLEDIRAIFQRTPGDRITTELLLELLNADPERPWATYNRGKSLTAKNLASFLRNFEIKSVNIRTIDKLDPQKGFYKIMFGDVFARYLTALPTPSPNAVLDAGDIDVI